MMFYIPILGSNILVWSKVIVVVFNGYDRKPFTEYPNATMVARAMWKVKKHIARR